MRLPHQDGWVPRKVKHVLTVDEVAAELGVRKSAVRNTMNRQGYYEVRGYLRTEVEAVKRKRNRQATGVERDQSE